MNRFKFLFNVVLTLAFVIALSNCSKKDVVQDEEGIVTGSETVTTDSGATAAATDSASSTPVGTEGAGTADTSSSEFKPIYFDYDSYRLRADALEALKANANWLKSFPSATIQIEGHCDERGTTEYNLALGERRAQAVKSYLEKLGIQKSRLSVISYGEERPFNPGHDESAWSENRRAQLVLTSK